MNAPTGLTSGQKEVFDRILGRKGDEARLDPAVAAVEKFLAERLQEVFGKAELEAKFSFEEQSRLMTSDLLEEETGRACVLLGNLSGPNAYIAFPFPAAGVIADMMLGGEPELAAAGSARPPTALEAELIRKFSNMVGKALQTVIGLPEAPEYMRLALSSSELRDDAASEPVIVFDITFSFGPTESVLRIALTHHLMLKMSRQEPQRIRRPHPETPSQQNRRALAVTVTATGSVSLQNLTLGDIAGLHEGKVIPFPGGAESGVRLKVKGRPLYECGLGRQGTNFALCLQKPHKVMDEVLTGIGVPVNQTKDEDEDDE